MSVFLRNIKTNDIYKCESPDGIFENLRTRQKGKVPEHIAQANLRINLELTDWCNKYPAIETLIRELELKAEK